MPKVTFRLAPPNCQMRRIEIHAILPSPAITFATPRELGSKSLATCVPGLAHVLLSMCGGVLFT